ncbi:helix-turn-helix domain-containing protein [Ornithinibacillus scapharcae]|uniref:helix-turn-helix domain-containing protein n=1 Tax=Ornithinibacillus scapharcae TaxID=1147159 RepID=UPI000225B518|nr:RodZ domain-containing protein [Ornithinibacillus scapharcae]
MGIGARLREARESKDLSLDTLQDITKIQKRYLVAIEEENFSVLPGKFYAKAFIKEYAIAVGLDPNQLMEEYVEDIPSPEEDTTQYTRIHRSRKDNMPTKSNAIFSFIPTLIVVILIIGIFFLAWWFITSKANDDNSSPNEEPEDSAFYRDDNKKGSNNSGSDDENSDDNKDDTNDKNATDEDQEQDTTEDNATDNQENDTENEAELGITVLEQGTVPKPQSEVELTNVGEELILEFTATADVWLDVKSADGQSFYSNMVKPNEPVELTLTGQQRFLLNIGNAPGMTVKINDVALEYPVDPTQRGADHQRIWLNVVESNE